MNPLSIALGAGLVFFTASTAIAQYVSHDPDLLDHGKEIYQRECSVCHGANGEGDGPGAKYLAQRPRNLTLGVFKIRSTPTGHFPTSDDLFNTITRGIAGSHGAQMPSFASLPTRDRWALVEVVRDFAGMDKEGTPITIPPRPQPANPVLGREIYDRLQCAACHGESGVGDGTSSLSMKDDDKRRVFAADLTDGKFKGGDQPEDVFTRFYTGLDGSPMPAYAGKASDAELWALTEYVLKLSADEARAAAEEQKR